MGAAPVVVTRRHRLSAIARAQVSLRGVKLRPLVLVLPPVKEPKARGKKKEKEESDDEA